LKPISARDAIIFGLLEKNKRPLSAQNVNLLTGISLRRKEGRNEK